MAELLSFSSVAHLALLSDSDFPQTTLGSAESFLYNCVLLALPVLPPAPPARFSMLLFTKLSCGPLTGKGLSHRPRPSSPFSTDGSTVGTHSLGHQRATRPTRKPRSQGAAPHRRDPGADGESVTEGTILIVHAPNYRNICCFVRMKLHL